eukprot:4055705-Lingulodinium_polyedra.AAC.1
MDVSPLPALEACKLGDCDDFRSSQWPIMIHAPLGWCLDMLVGFSGCLFNRMAQNLSSDHQN